MHDADFFCSEHPYSILGNLSSLIAVLHHFIGFSVLNPLAVVHATNCSWCSKVWSIEKSVKHPKHHLWRQAVKILVESSVQYRIECSKHCFGHLLQVLPNITIEKGLKQILVFHTSTWLSVSSLMLSPAWASQLKSSQWVQRLQVCLAIAWAVLKNQWSRAHFDHNSLCSVTYCRRLLEKMLGELPEDVVCKVFDCLPLVDRACVACASRGMRRVSKTGLVDLNLEIHTTFEASGLVNWLKVIAEGSSNSLQYVRVAVMTYALPSGHTVQHCLCREFSL